MRRVKFLEMDQYQKISVSEPQRIEFTLIKRNAKNTVALPSTTYKKWTTNNLPSIDQPDALKYAKVMIGTKLYNDHSVQLENETLQSELNSLDVQDYESAFIQLCLLKNTVYEIN